MLQNNSYLRFTLLGLAILGYLIIGYLKTRYIIHFSDLTLLPYYKPTDNDFAHSISGVATQITSNNKWLNDMFLLFSMVLFSCSIVHLLFLDTKLTLIHFGFYFSLIGIILLCFLTGIATNNITLSYEIPRFIKNKILLSQFVVVLFIGIKKYFIT